MPLLETYKQQSFVPVNEEHSKMYDHSFSEKCLICIQTFLNKPMYSAPESFFCLLMTVENLCQNKQKIKSRKKQQQEDVNYRIETITITQFT